MKKLIALILTLTLVFALASCGSKPAEIKSADLKAFYEGTFVNENMPMMGVMEGEMLDAFYAGLSALDLKQCIVAMPMISAVGAEVALVEVNNAADIEKVQEIFKARIQAQIDGGAFYPATIEAWEKSSEIVVNNNTVMLICLETKENFAKERTLVLKHQ